MRPLYGVDVERVRAFADAVFAIAITLLALEMTVPEDLPSAELGHALKEALPSVAGYLWISHHRLFHMAEALDGPLLYLDLALMALVAALPFPTKIITAYHNSAVATSLYAGTITLSALLITAMAGRLLRRPALCHPDASRSLITQSLHHAVAVAVIFGSSVPVTLISPDAAEYWWVLLAVPVRICVARRHATRSQHASVAPSSSAP